MRRYNLLFLVLILLINNSFAQVKPLTDDEKQKLKTAQALLDSIKKANPALGNSIPDLNSIMSNMQQGTQGMQQIKDQQMDDATKNLPVAKPGMSIRNIAVPTQAMIIAMARAKLAEALTHLESKEKAALSKMAEDTSINLAGTAMMLIADGAPKYEGQYLVCRDIINRPTNPWPINDLAILYRDIQQYKEAISCFLYAMKQNDSLLVIKTNLAWASAYYGDVLSAKKYFNEVLAVKDNYGSALEGLALIAYKEGDIQALFKCLMKEVTGFGGGGSGPSEEFMNVCGGVSDMNTDDEDKDPTTDNTFDNVSDDDPAQDPPPGADEQAVKYPEMKQIFIGDAMELAGFFANVGDFQKTIKDETEKSLSIPNEKFQALSPLKPKPYIDEQGNKIVPYSYEKFFNLFGKVDALFERRKRWFEKKFDEQMAKFLEKIIPEQMDMQSRYYKKLMDCKNDDACGDEVNCTFIPMFHGAKNGELESVKAMWNEYYNKIIESCNWYISASSPFIKRVHNQALNEYMNTEREWAIRRAFLSMYGKWIDALINIHDNPLMRQEVKCKTELRLMSDAPNPDAQPLKKLKTFAGPCYKDNDPPTNLLILTYEDNCQRTKISIGTKALSEGTAIPIPEFNLSFEKDYSPKFKEDDQFKLSAGFAVSKKIGILNDKGKFSNPAGGEGDMSAKLEGEVSATVENYWKFDSNGNLIATGSDASFEASVKGKSGFKDTDNTGTSFDSKFSAGIKASYEVEVQCGQDSPPDPRVTTHLEKSMKGSGELK